MRRFDGVQDRNGYQWCVLSMVVVFNVYMRNYQWVILDKSLIG